MSEVHVLLLVATVGVVASRVWRANAEKLLFPRILALKEEIRQMRTEAAELSNPSTFAQSSKLERKANEKQAMLDGELRALTQLQRLLPMIVEWALRYVPAACYIVWVGNAYIADVGEDMTAVWRVWSSVSEVTALEYTLWYYIAARGVEKSFMS
eukprot:TRINITY_DN15163_c0_g1_i1.p1 TRINITY_DN15163_c0_g1~~TRINITY_DN15163_c0_g1_i1.p1  ORF type:complete len:155 (+),score=48.90 TRINITY_DN15163_c0_g1_i1:27-491(+)